MKGVSGFYPALKLPQDANQARPQLDCELIHKTQELAWRYNNKWIITMQQGEDVPTASEPEGSPAPGPSSSPAHPSRTPPLPVTTLPDIPCVGTSLVGDPFAEFLAIPTQKVRPLFQQFTQ